MLNTEWKHDTVLLASAVTALNIKKSGVYVDGTFGRGGHSVAILQQLDAQGRLLVLDKDTTAIEHAKQLQAQDPRISVWHGSFTTFPQALAAAGLAPQIDGLLLDLGVSSPQLDDAQRGFSFMRAGPLDMRMDASSGQSAAQWLATATESDIADVLWLYGEERFSRQIARRIVATRSLNPLNTTTQLAELISDVVRKREPGKHPATRSFQAIRIKINQELQDLETCLPQAVDYLAPQGRLVVISFHSLEDRLVKHYLREVSTVPPLPKGLPIMSSSIQPRMRLIGKAVRPNEEEVCANARARSAIMRVAERVV